MRGLRRRGLLRAARVDGFLLALFAALGLASVVPEIGATGGPLAPEVTTKGAIALVFFLHGARLSRKTLHRGLVNLRLHALIQVTTFAVFPLLGLLGAWALTAYGDGSFAIWAPGLLLLSALPSTISSAVVLTATARGDVAAAVFNAALSNLAAAVITPVWVVLLLETGTQQLALGPTLLSLSLLLLAPFLLGQALHTILARHLERHRQKLSWLERGLIVALVFTAFSDFFKDDSQVPSWLAALAVLVVCSLILATVKVGLWWISKKFGIDDGARITALFCGSHKSLATGVPLAQLIFGTGAHLGPLLVPLLIYHPLQLVVGGWLSERLARRSPPT